MLVYFFMVFIASFLIMLVAGKFFIAHMAHTHFRSLAREYTPEAHRAKDFTPTMGGLCMIAVIIIMMAISAVWSVTTKIIAFILCGFCVIGTWDDCNKIFYKKGISERKKFMGQCVIALSGMMIWYLYARPSTILIVPFLFSYDLGPLVFIVWTIWVILCTVNAVNFTDGLDGLATLILITNFVAFGAIAFLLGNIDIALACAIIVGVLLGFLWYNAHPAQIFMGDAGALSLGAALATIALMLKAEMLIPLAGGIFVLEGVSVALQIVWFKVMGRRIFRMAPLHHHFELLGYSETKITARFFIVSLFLCATALLVFVNGIM